MPLVRLSCHLLPPFGFAARFLDTQPDGPWQITAELSHFAVMPFPLVRAAFVVTQAAIRVRFRCVCLYAGQQLHTLRDRFNPLVYGHAFPGFFLPGFFLAPFRGTFQYALLHFGQTRGSLPASCRGTQAWPQRSHE